MAAWETFEIPQTIENDVTVIINYNYYDCCDKNQWHNILHIKIDVEKSR